MLSLLQSDFKVSFESLTTLHDNVTSKVTVAVWLLMPVSLLEQPIQIDHDVWIHKSNSEMTVYNESINCQLFMMLQHYRITTHITTHFLIRIEWHMLCHNDGEQVGLGISMCGGSQRADTHHASVQHPNVVSVGSIKRSSKQQQGQSVITIAHSVHDI